jgi:lipoprotein Spr
MAAGTVSWHLKSKNMDAGSRKGAQTNRPKGTERKTGAYLRFLTLASVFLFLSISDLQAQHKHAKAQAICYAPTDINQAKLEAFYADEAIDLHHAMRPELYFEIFRWYKTCYCYGGNSKKGIDCSHFVNMLYEKIYGITLGPDVKSIYHQCHAIKKNYHKAKEGDLVFFRIDHRKLSHVGIYLQNGKFAHASTHQGVIISDLSEPYYKKHFARVGRVTG